MNENTQTKTFNDFDLSPNIQKAIKRLGYEEPTEIQAETIPHVIEGRDVVGESATGSGKTLAFGVGAIQTSTPKKGVQALILVPTRELAEQVTKSINELNNGKTLKVISVYGGVSINAQIDALRCSEIVVATPGRLKDHIQRGTIDLSRVKLLVLDEADRMLDMGFIEDIEDIVKQCPKQRQTLFFSATFPPEVRHLVNKYLQNPENVKVRNQVDPKLLKQIYYDVRRGDKLSLLIHLIKKEKSNKLMIFCNTRINSDLVQQNLEKNNIKAAVLHGGLTQAIRTKIIQRFKEEKLKILVCTDVAARGIHVDDITHVYNYDIPKDSNDYVHRIGRTARAGSEGLVLNLLCDFDHQNFSKIMNNYDFNIEKVEMPKDMQKIRFDPTNNKSRGRFSHSRSNQGQRGQGRGSRDGERRGRQNPRRDNNDDAPRPQRRPQRGNFNRNKQRTNRNR